MSCGYCKFEFAHTRAFTEIQLLADAFVLYFQLVAWVQREVSQRDQVGQGRVDGVPAWSQIGWGYY